MESLALQKLRTYLLPLCLPVITLSWSWQARQGPVWTGPWANLPPPGPALLGPVCHIRPLPLLPGLGSPLPVFSTPPPTPTPASIRKLDKETEG